jgi:branched-chain amino acid transport system substrate-binding protein
MKRMMTEMGIDLVLALTAIFVIYWAVRGFGIYQPPSKLREAVGEAWEKNGFSIAVVWPAHRDLSFVEGAEFALEENNATHNVLSQKIRLRMFTERWINQATRIAQRVAANSDVVAVIGHEFSSSALAASLIYETRGILYLAPQSTDPSLTTHGFQFVFRMTPDDRAMAAALVGFAKQQKFSKIAILYARTTLGESLGPRLVSELAKHGMELAFYHSYLPLEDWPRPDFRPMIADLMQKPFDAVMVVDQ